MKTMRACPTAVATVTVQQQTLKLQQQAILLCVLLLLMLWKLISVSSPPNAPKLARFPLASEVQALLLLTKIPPLHCGKDSLVQARGHLRAGCTSLAAWLKRVSCHRLLLIGLVERSARQQSPVRWNWREAARACSIANFKLKEFQNTQKNNLL